MFLKLLAIMSYTRHPSRSNCDPQRRDCGDGIAPYLLSALELHKLAKATQQLRFQENSGQGQDESMRTSIVNRVK